MASSTSNPHSMLLVQRKIAANSRFTNRRNIRAQKALQNVNAAAIQFFPQFSFGIDRPGRSWVAAQSKLKRRALVRQFRRAGALVEQLRQRVGVEDMEPPSLVVGLDHSHPQRRDERPVLVAISAFHFCDGLWT